ncbi:BTB/POZ domain-containing protein 3-like [Lutzomyia longipalpis]|uniref:BTB/POZ domain-containing protein 3-like n=1 Tax=Lutzomyia longipalpis TaxID=7200 RepID=UPI0024835353|nr:BTB/POZ domain-containing protein 3-like [Lutzomyia longipalpis]
MSTTNWFDSNIPPTASPEKDVSWQATKCSVRERNAHLVGNELMSDVTFVVGAGRVKIPAHRHVLASTSASFYEALYERKDPPPEIEVTDVEEVHFRTLLRYMYCDELSTTSENCFELLRLSLRFGLRHMETQVVDYIEKSLCTDNVLDIFQQSTVMGCQGLRERCYRIIEWTIREILNTEKFVNTSREILGLILQMPRLNCREVEIYRAVMAWIEHQCLVRDLPIDGEPRREWLGLDLLHLIRFPTMTAEEFSECATVDGFLTADEISRIFLVIMDKFSGAIEFSHMPRTSVISFETSRSIVILNRFSKWSRGFNRTISYDHHSVLISVTKPTIVAGFGLLLDQSDVGLDGAILTFASRDIQLDKLEAGTHINRIAMKDNFYMVHVLLEQPMLLETNEVYLVKLTNPTNGFQTISGEVRDKIAFGNALITFKKPTKSPYVNAIAEILTLC